MSLSIKNGWIDNEDRVYIYFPVEEVMELMNCKSEKATRLLAELDSKKGIGLIKRVRQGQGKPSIIYVKNFAAAKVYMVFGHNMLNDMLEEACDKMGAYLDQQGHRVFLPPASVGRDENEMMGIISNRHSAVAAGLAEFGLNGLVLTPSGAPGCAGASL